MHVLRKYGLCGAIQMVGNHKLTLNSMRPISLTLLPYIHNVEKCGAGTQNALANAARAQAGHVADSNTSRQYTANTVNNPLERPLKRLKKDVDGGLVVLPDA